MSRLAIVHPTTLLGRELREALSRHPARPASDIRLLSAVEEEIGTVTEIGGTAALVGRFDPLEIEGTPLVFFCGDVAIERPLLAQLPAGTVAIVLSADATAEDGAFAVADIGSTAPPETRVWVSPHPAVVGLAHLVAGLRPLGLRGASVTVAQPASHRGQPGIDELFEETRGILAFTAQPRPQVFRRQLAFNLLPCPGVGEGLATALAAALGSDAPPVRLQSLQGGMFHGLAISADLRFDTRPTPHELATALTADPWIELARDVALLGPIDGSGSDKILIGDLRVARAAEGGSQVWLWAVLDNLTVGGALNALALARPWLD